MSVPSVRPAFSTAVAIRSSAARLESRLGREAAFVAEPGREALGLEHGLEGVVDRRARSQRLGERRRTDRRDHELLHVDVAVGVRAAVEDVHHRHRQQVGVRAADVAEQREPADSAAALATARRDAEDRVGAEPGLVGGAVEVEQRLVDEPLLVGGDARRARRRSRR